MPKDLELGADLFQGRDHTIDLWVPGIGGYRNPGHP